MLSYTKQTDRDEETYHTSAPIRGTFGRAGLVPIQTIPSRGPGSAQKEKEESIQD